MDIYLEKIIADLEQDSMINDDILQQIREYLSGQRISFDYDWSRLKFKTDFQRRVLRECAKIPYGQTDTYSGIAEKINSPRAARAVGTALRHNPYAIFIPCHRVVRKGGVLGNYAFGVGVKQELLDFEKIILRKTVDI